MALFKEQVKLICLVLISSMAMNFTVITMAKAADREYAIKAVFLYNFFNYIQWPDEIIIANGNPSINLCIYGDDPFGAALIHIQKKMAKKMTLTIVHLKPKDRIDKMSCHMLYVSLSEKSNLDPLIDRIKHHGVLTVSDINGFSHNGGIIELARKGDKIKLIINISRLETSGFRANSQILKIANLVP